MKPILSIARNTFKEAIRNRILYVILIFALILIGFSGVVSELTISSREKIIKSLGFMAINLFGVAIAVFVGVSLVYNELEKKTIYTIVSKPIGRWQFLLGKYFGLLLTVWVNVTVMTLFLLASIHYHSGVGAGHGFLHALGAGAVKACVTFVCWNAFEITNTIMPVYAVTVLELAIVTAFAILFSSFSTPTLSMFFTVLTFIAGRLNEDIVRFADQIMRNAEQTIDAAGQVVTNVPTIYYVALAIAHVVPNLGAYQHTVELAIYENTVALWWGTVVYGLLYTTGVLCLSILIFSRRNFK